MGEEKAALEQIDGCINQVSRLEFEDKEAESQRIKDIRDARRRAERNHSISRFFEEVKVSRDPGFQRACDLEANHFRELAELEEAHIARRLDFGRKWAELKDGRSRLLAELLALRDKASATVRIESN
jgi:hypothetical protein